MRSKELLEIGFQKEEFNGGTWYELKIGNHIFITNDSYFNKGKDTWHIGYEDAKTKAQFWFGNRLKDIGQFKMVYRMITGKELKVKQKK